MKTRGMAPRLGGKALMNMGYTKQEDRYNEDEN